MKTRVLIQKLFSCVISLTALSSCARYAVRHPQSFSYDGPARVLIPDNFQIARDKISEWLKNRNLLERVLSPSDHSEELYFITPWKRNYSLRYYYLEFDTRLRHLAEWKSQWKLKPSGPMSSVLEVKVLEVIHLGPARFAPALPEIEEVKKLKIVSNLDWAESPPDKLRALLEIRRLFNELYPLTPLPSPLAGISVPDLEMPPLSSRLAKRAWTPWTREKSF